jgi:hypothetical protein
LINHARIAPAVSASIGAFTFARLIQTVNSRDGLVAGFAATVALSMTMMVKHATGLMPRLDPVAMLTEMVARMTGTAPFAGVGWAVHFFIGTVMWGLLYSMLARHLPGAPIVRGMLFAVGAWLLMMLLVMPLAGAGPFGLRLGVGAPVTTLLMHLVFGAVLGVVYARSGSSAAYDDVRPA